MVRVWVPGYLEALARRHRPSFLATLAAVLTPRARHLEGGEDGQTEVDS